MGLCLLLTREIQKTIYSSMSRPFEQNILGHGIVLKGMGMFALRCFRCWRALRYVLSGDLFDK